jgi:GTPase SAR1 family protein
VEVLPLTHRQFTTGYYSEEYDPTLEAGWRKLITLDEEPVILTVYEMGIGDNIGGTYGTAFLEHTVRTSDGVVILYSVNSRECFERAGNCLTRTKELVRKMQGSPIPIFLVGNKADRDVNREVSTEEAQRLSHQEGCGTAECCAREDEHGEVDQIFLLLTRLIRRGLRPHQAVPTPVSAPEKVSSSNNGASFFVRLKSQVGFCKSK